MGEGKNLWRKIQATVKAKEDVTEDKEGMECRIDR